MAWDRALLVLAGAAALALIATFAPVRRASER
jgi:ABC-type lipoprotein release transport system permease subunit